MAHRTLRLCDVDKNKKQRWLNKFEYTKIHTIQKSKRQRVRRKTASGDKEKGKDKNYHHENLDDKIILMF
jgi:hypothetical protein